MLDIPAQRTELLVPWLNSRQNTFWFSDNITHQPPVNATAVLRPDTNTLDGSEHHQTTSLLHKITVIKHVHRYMKISSNTHNDLLHVSPDHVAIFR
jgi:hypothetical protein